MKIKGNGSGKSFHLIEMKLLPGFFKHSKKDRKKGEFFIEINDQYIGKASV